MTKISNPLAAPLCSPAGGLHCLSAVWCCKYSMKQDEVESLFMVTSAKWRCKSTDKSRFCKPKTELGHKAKGFRRAEGICKAGQ